MGFLRDEGRVTALKARAENAAVLAAVEHASAHGDLGELVLDFASAAGLDVHALSTALYPSLVATPRGADLVVVAAAGMEQLLVRVVDVPAGAVLPHTAAPALGQGWWRIAPFTGPRDELPRWFAAAARVR